MNIVIDIGNSNLKLSLFKEDRIIESVTFNRTDVNKVLSTLQRRIEKHKEINKAILSSVSGVDIQLENFLTKSMNLYINVNHETEIPIKILYKTPITLGVDRLAAVVGANNIFPDKNVLIFDAGTALTIDFINSNNEYVGGNISPGIMMRFKALNEYTEKLPLLKAEYKYKNLIAQTTKDAVLSGVQNGILFEIQGYIERFKKKYSNLKIIFTGGDAFFFELKIKKDIFAAPEIVMKGLNRILEYNAKKYNKN